jgi:hypothetical protein
MKKKKWRYPKMNANYNYCNNIFLHRVEKNKLLDAIATRRNARNQ